MTAFHVLFVILWQGLDILEYFAYKYNQHKCFFIALILTNYVRPFGTYKESITYRIYSHNV